MILHDLLSSLIASGLVIGVINVLIYFVSMGHLRPSGLLRAWAFMLMAALTLLSFRLINRTNPEWADTFDDWGIMVALIVWCTSGILAVYVSQTRIGGRRYWTPITVVAALGAAAVTWTW